MLGSLTLLNNVKILNQIECVFVLTIVAMHLLYSGECLPNLQTVYLANGSRLKQRSSMTWKIEEGKSSD
jgi:hypothetical protein